MKKAVVTGGAGFIGSHIVEELVNRKVSVIAIDTVKPGGASNIAHLLNNELLEYIQCNIEDYNMLERIFAGIEYVFHHAASPNPRAEYIDFAEYYNINSRGILNVLQSARDNRVKKVIFASSSAVYGNTQNQKLSESMLPQPQSPYAVCKLIAEHYCDIYNRIHGLPTVCLRYFNVYGPRQNPDSQLASVIPKFIRSIKKGKPPIVYGDGEQSRDFVYVADVAKANLLAAESEATGIYNVGTGEPVSLNKLLETLLLLMERKDIKAGYENERPEEIKHSLADISKARSIGYSPKYGLEEGLREMLLEKIQISTK